MDDMRIKLIQLLAFTRGREGALTSRGMPWECMGAEAKIFADRLEAILKGSDARTADPSNG